MVASEESFCRAPKIGVQVLGLGFRVWRAVIGVLLAFIHIYKGFVGLIFGFYTVFLWDFSGSFDGFLWVLQKDLVAGFCDLGFRFGRRLPV